MIAGGCLDGVDRVFGLHVWNFMDVGTIGVRVYSYLFRRDTRHQSRRLALFRSSSMIYL